MPEPVLAVLPGSHREALRLAFEVGNRHFPLGARRRAAARARRHRDGAASHAARRRVREDGGRLHPVGGHRPSRHGTARYARAWTLTPSSASCSSPTVSSPPAAYAHSFGLETLRAGRTRARRPRRRGPSCASCWRRAPARATRWRWRPCARRAAPRDLERALRIDATLDAHEAGGRAARGEPADGPPDPARGGGGSCPATPRSRSSARWTAGRTPGHHAVAFGLVAAGGRRRTRATRPRPTCTRPRRSWSVRRCASCRSASSRDSACCSRLRPRIARLAGEARRQALPDDSWTFTPALDVAAMRHARLDARLFRS